MSLDPLRVASLSQRPGSSHSIHSTRSVSRASQRPISRLSQRSITKQPRLAALLNTLVKQVTGWNAEYDTEDIQDAVDLASKRIDQMKQAMVLDSTQIDARFRG
jgi:gamma-tubulin complex component 5